jgi:hypothetical protein
MLSKAFKGSVKSKEDIDETKSCLALGELALIYVVHPSRMDQLCLAVWEQITLIPAEAS